MLTLALVELFHALAHFAVLTGEYSIKPNFLQRRLYFLSDTLSVLVSWYLLSDTTLLYQVLVVIHFTIHFSAMLHLTNIVKTKFFRDVFELAEQNWSDKHWLIQLIYIGGTLEDILVHLINVFLLTGRVQL